MLQAMFSFSPNPQNCNNAAMKMRSSGKAGYTYAFITKRNQYEIVNMLLKIIFVYVNSL
jgi:hypothetical protein